MLISSLDVEKLTDEELTNLLFIDAEDDHRHGDCIFVAGSSKAVQYRLPIAVELYKQGKAKKILFSGGVKWNGNDAPEAVLLKQEAMALGVPECDILVEDQSLHTLENVLASLLVLNRAMPLHTIQRLLVVTSSYHMRRLHLTLKTYMPDWIDFRLCPAQDRITRKDNWFLTEIGRKRVLAEAGKVIHYVQQGALMDEEVRL